MATITCLNSNPVIAGGEVTPHTPSSRESNTRKRIPFSGSFADEPFNYGKAALAIRTLSRQDEPIEALGLFRELAGGSRQKPSALPLCAVLRCCVSLQATKSGREVHGFVVRNGGEEAAAYRTLSALACFYANCGLRSTARKVFDRMPMRDVVSWTIILMAYANGHDLQGEVMSLFLDMLWDGVLPNRHSLTVIMRCASLTEGKQLQAYITKRGWNSDAFIGSSLTDMYARNRDLDGAKLIFDRIKHKDVVCYNSLLLGYSKNGLSQNLLSVFDEMSLAGLLPNQSTMVGLLNGCASVGLLGLARQFHAHTLARGFGSDEVLQAIVVDMYAKCGDLESARVAFHQMGAVKNIAGWNSMVCGFGKHGHAAEAFEVFDSMQRASFSPDHITFTCLLSACSHSGAMVDEGWKLFNLMGEFYGVPPRKEHYSCMVDLLGRAGRVREAYEFITRSNVGPVASVWGALLAACRVWGDAEIGEIAARKLFAIEPEGSGSYVGLAGIFSANERWDEAAAVRRLMDCSGVKKDSGCSLVDVGGGLRKFRAGEGDAVDWQEMEEVKFACERLNANILGYARNEMLVGSDGT
ncbi:Pentatricopeptide repeat-containing protein [Platanthera zijinensis]|uniref:Pentatricopeptide repeat-containing protein n=1 Tax=Platanthera zijinensis TaxID=2320716 RepID=A0AAP0GDL5_9ASPA